MKKIKPASRKICYLLCLASAIIFVRCNITENNASVSAKIGENNASDTTSAKTITEVFYLDNGAVVPNPTLTKVKVNFLDTLNSYLTYQIIRPDDTTTERIKIETEQFEFFQDQAALLAEIADGEQVKPGKKPCIGAHGIDISVVFSTGDTNRFRLLSAARCDESILPAWHALDSVAKALHQAQAAPPQ